MRQLRATKLLKEITPELAVAPDALWRSIARARSLPCALRVGARLADQRRSSPARCCSRSAWRPGSRASRPTRSSGGSSSACCRLRGATSSACSRSSRCSRGCSTSTPPVRAQRSLLHRSSLDEAITWLEIHGDRPDVVAHWRNLQAQGVPAPAQEHAADHPFRARRRRRGRRRSPLRRAAGVAARESRCDQSGPGARTGSRRRAPSAGAAASPARSRCSAAAGR